MRALFFVVAALAALSFARTSDWEFNGDYNLTNAEADFSFRYITAETFNLIAANALAWFSCSLDLSGGASQAAKATANAMVGIGVQPTALTLPFVILGYGKGEAAVDIKWKDFFSSLISATPKLNVDLNGGFVAMVALGLQEIDPDGNKVGDFYPLLSPPSIFSHTKNVDGDEGNVNGLYHKFSPSGCKADVMITYVTSKRAGVIGYGETPVSPRTYEMIIEVDGFSLKSKKNHVRLSLAFLSASGQGHIEGSAKVVPTEAGENLYIAASNRAIVDGDREEVSVSIAAGSDNIDSTLNAILSVVLQGGDYDRQIANIDFPAGEKSFIYDPAIGTGRNIYDAGASTIALSLLVVALSLLVYLF